MELKYSKQQFDGFTHRFKVRFQVDEDWRNDSTLDIYFNSNDYQKLEDFINEKKSTKVISFNIEHRASKEQDEMTSKFIDETKKYNQMSSKLIDFNEVESIEESANRFEKVCFGDKSWNKVEEKNICYNSFIAGAKSEATKN